MRNIIILGGTVFAKELAKRLRHRDNKLMIVIEDKDDAMLMSAEENIIVINGHPTEPKILDSLDLEDCDILIAATEYEELNILGALYAKNAGIRKIYVKTIKSSTERILRKMEITPVNSDIHSASSVALDIVDPLVSDLVGIGVGKFDIIEKHVKYFPNLTGKMLSDVRGDFFATLAVCTQGDVSFLPESKIFEDSVLIVVREAGKRKELARALKEL